MRRHLEDVLGERRFKMDGSMLYCVTMTDASETRGAAAELLSALYDNVSSWKDEESGIVKHTLYFQTPEEASSALKRLDSEAGLWEDFGISVRDFSLSPLKKEDWAESWKIHFKPLEISERLAVKPSWEIWDARPGQVVLELDPGMSFGTGQHATTRFCLTALDRFVHESSGGLSMLDAGSGSGILSIAAYHLGCRPVRAFDIDPETLPVARENARKNGIPDSSFPIVAASLEDYTDSEVYDIVAANILSSALIAGRRKLLSLVKPGGRLILAGILDSEYDSVRASFEEIGCVQLFSAKEKEWRGGAFAV